MPNLKIAKQDLYPKNFASLGLYLFELEHNFQVFAMAVMLLVMVLLVVILRRVMGWYVRLKTNNGQCLIQQHCHAYQAKELAAQFPHLGK